MPFILDEGPMWLIREVLATHPVTRALAALDGAQRVQVTAAQAVQPPTVLAPVAAAEASAAPPLAATPGRKRR